MPFLALCLWLGPVPQAVATLLLDEPFDYATGPLETVGFGVWTNNSSTAALIDVSSGQVVLTQTEGAEAVGARLTAPGPDTLYASFTVNFSSRPSGGGGAIFAQFRNGAASRARVFARTNGAAASSYRLALANAAGAPAVTFPADLSLNTNQMVVVRYNVATGASTLWVNPTTGEQSTSVTAADPVSGTNIVWFELAQSAPTNSGMGILTLDNLKIANSFPEVMAVWDNRWASTNDSKWESPTQWSLGTPASDQSGPLLANAPSKTVTLDLDTALYFPSSLVVSNLTVTSPDASTTNTLLLNKVGTNNPLVVSNVFTLGGGGALTLLDSALHLPGLPSQPWGSPGFYVDGPVMLTTNASISASNVSLLAGNFAGSSNGAITLDGALILAGRMVLGNASGAFGSLTMNAGLLTFAAGTNLFIGGASNAVGTLTVNGGQLHAPNSLIYVGAPGNGTLTANGGEIKPWALRVGQSGPGKLEVQGGKVEAADYVLIGAGEVGTVSVTGGQLVATNSAGEIRVGGNSEGMLIVGSNGVVIAKSFNVATNDLPGQYARGTVEVQPGGALAAETHLVVGASAGSTGLVTVAGGAVTAPELIVGLTNGSGTLNLVNGSVTVSNLLVGLNSSTTGLVTVAGGTLTATDGQVQVGPAGRGQMNISGGNAIIRELRLGGSTNGAEGVVHLLAGRLTVLSVLSVNAFDGGGGDLDGSGGTVIIGEGHDGMMTVSAGTATNIGTLYIGYSSGFTGTLALTGGYVWVLTNAWVGDCASEVVGNVTLDDGTFYVGNAAQTAELNVRNGTVTLNAGGTLIVDNLVITNACARFLNNGGYLFALTTNLTANLDADGDGLPNGWEQANGLCPLSTLGDNGTAGDPDGDGQSNLAEYRAGTDPQNAASVFRLLSATVSGQNVRLDWTVVGGHSYVVQIATNSTGSLTNRFADFSGLISVPGTGEGETNYVHTDGATNRGAYYRARLGP